MKGYAAVIRAANRHAAAALIACGLAGAMLILWALRKTELRGDEWDYIGGAAALADWLTGRNPDWDSAFAELVLNAWFMPGMSFVGVPLFAVYPDAPNWVAFGWAGVVSAALFAVMLATLVPVVGARAARLFLVFPLLAPLWVAAALSFFPDVPAGLLVTSAMALAWRIGMGLMRAELPRWQIVAAFELCLAAALYIRGPVLLIVLGLHLILLALALWARGQSVRRRLLLATPVVLGLFASAAALAPWSIAVSRHMNHPVVTTTSFTLAFADGFGSYDKMCFGPCPWGKVDINRAREFSEAYAAQTGQHPYAVQRAMAAAAMDGMTPRAYLAEVRVHYRTFLFDPQQNLETRLILSFGIPPHLRKAVLRLAQVPTLLLYLPALAALLAANIVPVRSSDRLALQAVLIKGVSACMLVQPFLHHPNGRYWTAFAPIMTWAAILLVQAWRERRAAGLPERRMPPWLDVMQVLYGIGFVAVSAVILLA